MPVQQESRNDMLSQSKTVHTDAVELLKRSEDRLRLALESAQLGTWDFDLTNGVLSWDRRCKEMFGLSPEAYVDYDVFLNALHPDDRERVDNINQDIISGRSDGYYDTEYRAIGIEDKKQRWIRAKGRAYYTIDRKAFRYIGTVLDITAEKSKEERLLEQEERFRILATTIPQFVWTSDPDGTVDYMSEKWETYSGEKPRYEKGYFKSFIHPDDCGTLEERWQAAQDTNSTFNFEYRVFNRVTGEYRWVFVTIVPVKDSKGKTVKWIGSATDIHDQKMLEIDLEKRVEIRTRELSELNNLLEKSNTELEQFAFVASHDLKEPLRKIQTFTNIINIRFEEKIDPLIKPYLEKIEGSAKRMSDLIEDLLEFSRLSKQNATFQVVDLYDLADEVLTEFEQDLKMNQVTLQVGQLPTIEAAPLQIRQVFHNLIGNAIKFSKPNIPNEIRISSSAVTNEELASFPTLKQGQPHYKITFQDTGIGFETTYAEQIFTIFQRLHEKTTYEGHGIGLAICRKVVNNHNGVIFATGRLNEGSTFTVILPAAQNAGGGKEL